MSEDIVDGGAVRLEGYSAGWDDGFTAGHADGYATGYAAGQIAALSEVQLKIARDIIGPRKAERPSGELHGED